MSLNWLVFKSMALLFPVKVLIRVNGNKKNQRLYSAKRLENQNRKDITSRFYSIITEDFTEF